MISAKWIEGITLMGPQEVIEETLEWCQLESEEMRHQKITIMKMKKKKKYKISHLLQGIILFQLMVMDINHQDSFQLIQEMKETQRQAKVVQQIWLLIALRKESTIIKMESLTQSYRQWHQVIKLRRWNISIMHFLRYLQHDLNNLNRQLIFETNKRI